MKRIILTENQYKRLIKKNLNEQKIVFSNPKDEFDITNQMMQLLIHLEFFIDTIANKFLYIDKVENGIIYIDSAKYTKEEKDLINTEIDKWIVFTDSTRDKRSQDLTYNFGVDSDWDDLYPNEDVAVVDNDNNSATDDIDLDDNSTAEVEEDIDISDIEACKWGKNASGKDRKVILPPKEDIQFYKDVLKGIGSNVTCEKMLFFFAWRSGESSDSSFNPFATTYKDTDNECCYYNCLKNGVGYKPIACRTCPEGTSPGVRNYLNKKAGVNATVNTIKARYYPNLLRRLRNDNSTAMDLALETKELSVWGTGSLPKQILEKNSTIKPRKIKDYSGECGEATVVTTDCELTTEEVKFFNKHIRNDDDNLDFRYWVNQDSQRIDKVNKKLVDCGLKDPKLDINGSKNEYLEIAFALIGKDWVKAGKPKRPDEEEEEVVVDDVIYDSSELLTWSKRAKKDRDAGIINPTLISDIIKALKSINMRAQISWARTGHSKYTNSGSISRHWSGNAVDISVIEGVGNPEGKSSNKGIGNANFMKNGDRLVAELQKMGYTFGERGKTKGYLWRTNTGGNHWNHVHVSNKDRKKKVGTEIPKKTEEPKKSETKGNELPPNVQKLMDKLKSKWGVVITQSHIDKEYQMEGDVRPDAGSVNKTAENKIKELIKDCKKAYPNVTYPADIKSGYRSYDTQVDNFGTKVRDQGRTIDNVQASNCLPGFTQHHTGKAFDIFSVDSDWWDKNPNVKKWVADNCKKYGFKVTYTKPNQLRIPEPWHLFYIG